MTSKANAKKILLDQHGIVCQGCDREFEHNRYLEVDHIMPRSEGGKNVLENYALLCRPCNVQKSNRMTLAGLRAYNKKHDLMAVPDAPVQPRPEDNRRERLFLKTQVIMAALIEARWGCERGESKEFDMLYELVYKKLLCRYCKRHIKEAGRSRCRPCLDEASRRVRSRRRKRDGDQSSSDGDESSKG